MLAVMHEWKSGGEQQPAEFMCRECGRCTMPTLPGGSMWGNPHGMLLPLPTHSIIVHEWADPLKYVHGSHKGFKIS